MTKRLKFVIDLRVNDQGRLELFKRKRKKSDPLPETKAQRELRYRANSYMEGKYGRHWYDSPANNAEYQEILRTGHAPSYTKSYQGF